MFCSIQWVSNLICTYYSFCAKEAYGSFHEAVVGQNTGHKKKPSKIPSHSCTKKSLILAFHVHSWSLLSMSASGRTTTWLPTQNCRPPSNKDLDFHISFLKNDIVLSVNTHFSLQKFVKYVLRVPCICTGFSFKPTTIFFSFLHIRMI